MAGLGAPLERKEAGIKGQLSLGLLLGRWTFVYKSIVKKDEEKKKIGIYEEADEKNEETGREGKLRIEGEEN